MKQPFPLVIGGAMGAMLPWMLHVPGGSSFAIGFFALHVAAAIVLLGLGAFALRSGRTRRRLAKVHRPTLGHMGLMALGIITGAGLLHLAAHGLGGGMI